MHPLIANSVTKRLVSGFFLFAFILAGCNEFSRVQKSTDLNYKYEMAEKYYQKGDFTKSQILFDELYAVMRSTERAERVSYYLANSYYQLEDYYMAGYLFRNYFRTFPTSPHAAECLYMSAFCHFRVSPPYSLDQADTYQAIEEFQYFMQMFPTDTSRIRECNKMVDELHRKLEKKAFLTAKMYYEIQYYSAAISALEIFLHDYPDTKTREEAMYYIVDSKYYLAVNSIEAKKEERVTDAINSSRSFLATFSESEFTGRVNDIQGKAQNLKEKIENDKKTQIRK
ncbi:MAG TPA: outer membrane protein assembly factor BamD [Bacteroidia bacterium]|nr:outer membrane protein assembly factor BamD [Bacteroidia bacterium]